VFGVSELEIGFGVAISGSCTPLSLRPGRGVTEFDSASIGVSVAAGPRVGSTVSIELESCEELAVTGVASVVVGGNCLACSTTAVSSESVAWAHDVITEIANAKITRPATGLNVFWIFEIWYLISTESNPLTTLLLLRYVQSCSLGVPCALGLARVLAACWSR
jgi:hypothetical protein